MAISLTKASLQPKMVSSMLEELTLTAKGAKSKGYGPKVSELVLYDATEDTYTVPLMYAKGKFKLRGIRNPKNVGFEIKTKRLFRNGQKEVFDEAINLLRQTGSCFLQLHCGYGKTWMALNLAVELGVRTLILVHRTFLGSQFITEAEGIIPGQITFLRDDDVDGLGPDQTNSKAFVCTDRRALTLPEAFLKTIDLIIVDEAKYWCTPSRVQALLRMRPIYTLGLCAERDRKDGFDAMLDMFFGEVIFRKSIKPFVIWKYYTEFQPTIEAPKYGPARINWNLAMKSVSEMYERNIMIRDLCRLRASNKIMILVTFTSHVDVLFEMLKDVGEDVSKFYGNLQTFKNCRILIATYAKAEIGFDDKNLCDNFDGERVNLLILGSFYKTDIEQSAGRVMRTDAPEIISIIDDMPTLKKHAAKQDTWFKSRNGTVKPPEFIFDIRRKTEIPATSTISNL